MGVADLLKEISQRLGIWVTEGSLNLFRSKFNEFVGLVDSRSKGGTSQIAKGTWHSFAEKIIETFEQPLSIPTEKQQWLDILISYGDDTWHREIVDEAIIYIGKNAGQLDLTLDYRNEIFMSMVQKFPSLLKSRNKDNNRSLFHVAAINGSYEIISTCHKMLVDANGEKDGQALVLDIMMEKDQGGEGQSALFYAVSFTQTKTVRTILTICHIDDEKIMVPMLVKAIQLKSLETVQALLLSTSTDSQGRISDSDELQAVSKDEIEQSIAYRRQFITLKSFEAALEYFDEEILTFLVDQRTDILEDASCTLLHEAVHEGRYEAVALLAGKCPQLATRLKMESIKTSRNEMIKILRPVLYYVNRTNQDGHNITELILPILMKRLEISTLRDHLPGSKWGEIYLDLTLLKGDASCLNSFLKFVDEDLKTTLRRPITEGRDLIQVESFRRERRTHRQLLMTGESKRGKESIATDDLETAVDIKFEKFLKYIEIPFLDKVSTGVQTDVVCILDWLCICKGVRNVFEVRVQDSRYTPHSEEDIEHALGGLEIQELDWRRLDLSIYTILSCAPDIEKLHLYSSGSLATIDHWTGPNGVTMLANLKELHVTVIKDNLSIERVNRCMEVLRGLEPEFRQRDLHLSSQPWEIKLDPRRQVKPKDTLQKRDPLSVAKLGQLVEKYKDLQEESRTRLIPSLMTKWRTKVAILDTGVIAALFSGKGHRVVGRSFVYREPGQNERESPWWLATDPHGSYVANIISSIDPCCDIYVAQIAEHKSRISREAVLKAFEWVINEKVQIINCSFALFEEYKPLRAQIRMAQNEGIAVMSSTSDEGYIIQDVWPAKYENTNVFAIAACAFNGKFTAYSSEISAHFRVQGDGIDVSSPDPDIQRTNAIVNGSSVATAMASGYGSLMLACQQMHRTFSKSAISEQRSEQVIRSAFNKMVSPTTKNEKAPFVQPRFALPTAEDRFTDADDFKTWVRDGFGNILNS